MSGHTSFKHTAKQLFGSSSVSAIADLPRHLEHLCTVIAGGEVNPDDVIDRHTVLPYYTSTLPDKRSQTLRAAMKGDSWGSIHSLLGNRNTGVKNPRWLRYCPECAAFQESMYGISYWRRVHQLPGVLVCPEHRIVLKDSKVQFSRENNQRLYEILSPSLYDRSSDLSPQVSDEVMRHLDVIAEQSLWLLENKRRVRCPGQIREFYMDLLKKRNLVTLGGHIRMSELADQFNTFYGPEFLQAMGSWAEKAIHNVWLFSVLRNNHMLCHPLRHILLNRFLGTSVQDMLDPDFVAAPGPFGYGPWPCLNKACRYYRENVITRYTVTRNKKSKEQIGTFQCECGFTYTCSESRLQNADYSPGRVRAVGPIWLQEFQRLRTAGVSIRGMAHELGVSTTVIRRHLRT